jgi:hypothetical protein
MPNLEARGQDAHGRRLAALEPLDLEQHEVLLRLHARRACRQLPYAEESPDLVPQIGEGPVVDRRGHRRHIYITK